VRRALALLGCALAAAAVAACSETQEPPLASTNPIADSADQVIWGARQLLTNGGVLRADLHADTAFFFNDGTRIELRSVNTTFFATNGAKNGTLTSREGTYNTQIGQMSARKNVVVVSEDGRRLTTPELRYSEQTNLISSDSSFVATQGGRRLEGVGFETDPDMNNVRCKAACRGELGALAVPQAGTSGAAAAPPARGSRPNSFVLPGQQLPPLAAPPAPAATPAPAPAAADTSPSRPPVGTPPPVTAPAAPAAPATPPERR
jgi:LPS export ABC transporter protein LptC